jgi:hypothetical protein
MLPPIEVQLAKLAARQDAHEDRQDATDEAIKGILKKLDHILFGTITTLLAAMGGLAMIAIRELR